MDLDGRDIRDKLYGATRRLASGTAPLKARLRAALTAELIALRAEDFPWPDLGERWSGVINELASDQGPIVLLEQWGDFELIPIAQAIGDTYDQLARRLQAECTAPRGRNGATRPGGRRGLADAFGARGAVSSHLLTSPSMATAAAPEAPAV